MNEPTDTDILNWLEERARKSRTGISVDCLDGNFRFMRQHFISEPAKSLRDAVTRTMEGEECTPIARLEGKA